MSKLFLALFVVILHVSAFAQPQGVSLRATNGIGFGTTTIGGRLLATNTAANGGTNFIKGTLIVGTNALVVTTNGNVGISANSPTGRLDVATATGIPLISVTDDGVSSVYNAPITLVNYGGNTNYGLRNSIPMGISRESMWLGIFSNQRRLSLSDYVPAFDVPGFDPPMLDLEFGGEGFTFHVTPAGYGYHQDDNDPRAIMQLRGDATPQNTGSMIGNVGQVALMTGIFAENTVANPSKYWSSWGDVNTPFIYFRKNGTNDNQGAMKYQSATDNAQGLIETWYKSKGTLGSPTINGTADTIYDVVSKAFYGGTNWGTTAEIIMGTEGAPSNLSTPGFFAVKTTPSGSITPIERWRVSNDGAVKITSGSGVKMLEVQDSRSGVLSGDLTVANNGGVGGYVRVGRLSTNDSDGTYFFVRNRVATDIFVVDTGIAESYFMGKLGIGTATPGTPLHVVGDAQVSSGVLYANASGVSNAVTLIASGCIQITTNADGRTFTLSISGSGGDVLTNNRTIGTTLLGNVGIGTTIPDEKLEIGAANDTTTDRKALKFGEGGWAAPSASNALSDGDKLLLYYGSGYKTAIGMGALNDIWFTSANASGESKSFSFYTGGVNAAPTEKVTVLNSGKVGIGTTTPSRMLSVNGTSYFSNTVSVLNNVSTTALNVGGVLKTDTTEVGNVGAGTDTLITYTIPASQLGANGEAFEFDCWGYCTNNANTKQITVVYGATTLLDTTSLVLNNVSWRAHGRIVRTGAATQTATCEFTVGGTLLSAVNSTICLTTSPAETLSGTVVFKCTGTSTISPNNNDIVQNGMSLKWFPAGN